MTAISACPASRLLSLLSLPVPQQRRSDASTGSLTSSALLCSRQQQQQLFRKSQCRHSRQVEGVRCQAAPDQQSKPSKPTAESSLPVKAAWYASEVFGQAVSVFRPKKEQGEGEEDEEDVLPLSHEQVVALLRADYDKSYFVTGDMTTRIYDKDCEFADPFASFKGLYRFKRNVSNLGSFMEEVNLTITDWQEAENKISTKWRFRCILGLPWRPILAASGGTEHYFDPASKKIVKHVESWDISPADGLRQLVKPNPKQKKKA